MSEVPIEAFLTSQETTQQVRVKFSDTDAMGIVQYVNYVHYFEDGLVSHLRVLGYDSGKAFFTRHIAFPVKVLSVKYHQPALFDEVIDVVSSIESVGTSSLVCASKAYREETLLAEASFVRVCINIRTGKKVPIAEAFEGITPKQAK